MSPEQATGERVDARRMCTVWRNALRMATLKPVFDAEDRRDIVKHVLAGNPVAPHKVRSRVPEPLSLVISKSMARLDERYQSAQELADDLRRFLDGETVTGQNSAALTQSESMGTPTPYTSAAIVGLLILVLLLPFTTHYFFERDPAPLQRKGGHERFKNGKGCRSSGSDSDDGGEASETTSKRSSSRCD